MDAGGSNARFVECYQRNLAPMPKVDSWLNDEDCHIKNPAAPERRIYIWFCITHLFKAVRNALLHSQQGGSRAFLDANDCPFGWTRLIEFYNDLKNLPRGEKNANNLPRFTESVVYPLREKKMNVGMAEEPFKKKTVAHLIADSCQHPLVNLSCTELRAGVADEVSKLPFCKTVDKYNHGATRHGEHVEQVKYMQSQAVLRESVNFVISDLVSTIVIGSQDDSVVPFSNTNHMENHPTTSNSCHPEEEPTEPEEETTEPDEETTESEEETTAPEEETTEPEEETTEPEEEATEPEEATELEEETTEPDEETTESEEETTAPEEETTEPEEEATELEEETTEPEEEPDEPEEETTEPEVISDLVSTIAIGSQDDSVVAFSNTNHMENHPITSNSCHPDTIRPSTGPALTNNLDSTTPIISSKSVPLVSKKNSCVVHNPYTKKRKLPGNDTTHAMTATSNHATTTKGCYDIANPYMKKPKTITVPIADKQSKSTLPVATNDGINLKIKLTSTSGVEPCSMITGEEDDLNSHGALSDDEISSDEDDEFDDDEEEMAAFDIDDALKAHNDALKAHKQSHLLDLYCELSQERLQNPAAVSKIHSDLATLEYLAVGEAIFTNMLMSKGEKFTAANFEEYKAFLKKQLTYFERWKEAAIKRQKREGKKKKKNGKHSDSERSCLSNKTFRNLRMGVCTFINFVGYLLNYLPSRIQGFTYIPMQISNQTPLEGLFSVMRAYGFDNADFGTGITNKSIRCLFMALKQSSYDENSLVNLKEGWKDKSGSATCSKYGRQITKKLEGWISKRDNAVSTTLDSEQSNQPPTRFGGDSDIHKSELLRILGTKMTSTRLGSRSFADELLQNEVFQGWFRLGQFRDSSVEWFDCFTLVDETDLNEVCQKIMRTLFSLVESAIHDIKPSFEKAFQDNLMSSVFDHLYVSELPARLQGNRTCALYLVETLKTIFEEWFYDAIAELIVGSAGPVDGGDNDDDESHLDDETFLIMTHNMVGCAVSESRQKFTTDAAKKVIECMGFRTYKGDVDQTYIDENIPQLLQHCNTGGLTLIRPEFMEFSKELMTTCMDFSIKGRMLKASKEWISVGLKSLPLDGKLISKFKTAIDSIDTCIDDKTIQAIYKRVAECTFRSYTKWKCSRTYNSDKSSCRHTGNIKFRVLLQTGTSPNGAGNSKGKPKNPKKKNFSQLVSQMNGMQTSSNVNSTNMAAVQSINNAPAKKKSSTSVVIPSSGNTQLGTKKKKRRVSEMDFKEDYEDCVQEALTKLQDAGHGANKAALDHNQCCAVLWVCFHKYYKSTLMKKVGDSRSLLQTHINESSNFSAAAHLKVAARD